MAQTGSSNMLVFLNQLILLRARRFNGDCRTEELWDALVQEHWPGTSSCFICTVGLDLSVSCGGLHLA